MEKLRWGIIGSGGIARKRTLPGIMLAANAVCVAVMDRKEETVKAVRDEFGIPKAYTNLDEFLSQKDVDAVYIATPVFCHKEQVLKAAQAGKHILLEKPMGLTVVEAEEIAGICKEYGVKLGVGFMMRYHDAHQKIKVLIESGAIGEVVSAYSKFSDWAPENELYWRKTKAHSGGGAMMDMGIHCIDLLQYLTGLQVQKVVGMYGNQIFRYPDVEDAASAVLGMSNGSMFVVEANFNIPDTIGSCKFEIYGTKGRITAEGTIGQTETGSVYICTTEEAEKGDVEVLYESGNMYAKEIEAFSRSVLNDTKVPVTAEDGIFNQKIVEAIYNTGEQALDIAGNRGGLC